MTVPPMFGWEDIATVLALVLVAAVVTFLALAVGRSQGGRSDWVAGLDARSRTRREPAADPDDRPSGALGREPLSRVEPRP